MAEMKFKINLTPATKSGPRRGYIAEADFNKELAVLACLNPMYLFAVRPRFSFTSIRDGMDVPPDPRAELLGTCFDWVEGDPLPVHEAIPDKRDKNPK